MHLTFVYFAFISSFFFFNFCVAFHCMGCICHILFTPPLLRDICQFLVIMNKCCYKYLHADFSCLSGKYIGVEMLDLTVNICLLSEETAQLFSEVCVCVCLCLCVLGHLVTSASLWLHHPWNFSGTDTGACCHFLLQEIFPVQGLNPCFWCLLLWQADSLPLVPLEKKLLNCFPQYQYHCAFIPAMFENFSCSASLLGFPGGASGKEPACQCRNSKRRGLIPGSGRSLGEGNGNPLQYLDRGACQVTVRGVAQNRTRLKWLTCSRSC